MCAGTSCPGRTPHTAMLESSVVEISMTVAFSSEKRTRASGSNARWLMAGAWFLIAAVNSGLVGIRRKFIPHRRARGIRRARARKLEWVEVLPLPRQKIEHLEGQ